jgi:hypothetical protein
MGLARHLVVVEVKGGGAALRDLARVPFGDLQGWRWTGGGDGEVMD